uniref:CPBP family intramembrane metalloprotease n=1 Tax=Ignisphaera aggregans TaxID=334771 RepID=A0A7C5XGS2_9CREN
MLKILIFVALSYVFALIIDFIAIIFNSTAFIWGFLRMWSVTLSVVICLAIYGENIYMNFKQFFILSKKTFIYYLIAPLIVYGSLGIYIAIALPLGFFDFNAYVGVIANAIRSTIASLPEEQVLNLATITAYSQIASGYIAAISINAFFAIGEEIGWRGYLYRVLGFKPSLMNIIVIGCIWGFWHSSATLLLGYNYTVNRYIGVMLFTLYAMALTYPHLLVSKETGSVMPAASLHGAVNALWGLTIVASNLSIELREVLLGLGLLGIVSWIITSIVLYIIHLKRMR